MTKYKGFRIQLGNKKYTSEVYTIKSGPTGRFENYFGGANTIALAKAKIDTMISNK